MNLPNILTVSRIGLTLCFAVFTQLPGAASAWLALFFFAVAALTDLVDGYIARKYGLVTVFGQIMDPIADKLLILTALFIFSFGGMTALWMVALVACREILVTVARVHALTSGNVIPAESAGKWKTSSQMAAVSAALLYRVGMSWEPAQTFFRAHQFQLLFLINALMAAAVVLTLWSGALFFKHFLTKSGQ